MDNKMDNLKSHQVYKLVCLACTPSASVGSYITSPRTVFSRKTRLDLSLGAITSTLGLTTMSLSCRSCLLSHFACCSP